MEEIDKLSRYVGIFLLFIAACFEWVVRGFVFGFFCLFFWGFFFLVVVVLDWLFGVVFLFLFCFNSL